MARAHLLTTLTMESSCVRQTLIPATSRIFGDFLYDFQAVSGFFPHWYGDPGSFQSVAAQINYPASRRAALVSALREMNGPSEALDRLAQRTTAAVVTGQQVGLFSGPAYTIFKALTAVKVARQLTASGIPAVPIFWLATEDHDLAEVDHAWVFNQEMSPVKVALRAAASNGGPVGRFVADSWPVEELRTALGDLPFASEVVERIREAYRAGASLGSGFFQFLRGVLSGLGLVFIDPLQPAIREIGAPFLVETVERLPELLPAVRERSRELEAAGYHAQVNVEDDTSLLFLINGKRTPLRWKENRLVTKERTYSQPEIEALGTAISPNALLRPVWQDYLLPTVAYIGGPAEVAYLAQSAVIYEKLLGRMPVTMPRNSMTLLDGRAEKILAHYGMRVPDLLDCEETVRTRMAKRLIPSELAQRMSGLQATIADSLYEVQRALADFDPTLQAAANKSSAKMLYQAKKLASKVARQTMRRDERASSDASYVLNMVYPHRHLQERFYSIVPFLAHSGLDLPQRLLDDVQLTCPDHTVRPI